MKSYLLIFILAPFFCFAQQNKSQTTEKKSSATDCPTWKKKDVKANKADYFQYLKTSKSQKSVPAASTASKEKPVKTSQRTKNEEPEVQQKSTATKTDTRPIEKTASEKKTKTAAPQKDTQIQVVDNKESTAVIMPPKKSEEDDKTIAKTAKAGEQNAGSEKVTQEGSDKNEKLDDQKTKAKQKLTRLTRKTTKVRKHSNSKCPSF
jgi:hypothetical protein